jgi:hypothetical protein
MKKLLFGLIATVMMSVSGNAQTKAEPEYGTDVTISEYNKVAGGGGVGFLFEIGRASKYCRRVGICDVVAFWIVIYKQVAPTGNQLSVGIKGEKGNEYITLQLNNHLDPTKFDTTFYVDQDIKSNKDITIKKGAYEIDNSIGAFGGYKIPVTVNAKY